MINKLFTLKNNKNVKAATIALFILLILVSTLLAGCSTDNSGKSTPPAQEPVNTASPGDTPEVQERSKYYFEYKDVEIGMDDDAKPILKALGEPQNYFEAKSCAFEGMDKVYTYSGFELRTYADETSEHVSSVSFMDDSVNTREGICLSDKLDKIVSKYGEEYEQVSELYSYTDGNCKLSFLLENGEVASIDYSLVIE